MDDVIMMMTDNIWRKNRYSVAVTTIWSGASYVYSKDAVKILTQPTPKVAEKETEAKKEDETKTKQ